MIKKKKISYISEDSDNPGTQIKKFKDKLRQCQKDKEEYLTQAQRARADLVNYRRRQEEKIIPGIVAIGQTSIIHRVLPVLDSLKAGAKENKDIRLIKEQMENALKECNIEEIKALDEKFNPEFHEAIEQVESKKESGIITQVIQDGYTLNNKVLRPSKVKVTTKLSS